jgi:hypothetical protein
LPEVQVERPEGVDDKRNYRVSFDHIHTSLGFACEYSIEDTIRDLIRAYREEGRFKDYKDPKYSNVMTLKFMVPVRIIPRLDVKGNNLVKGVNLEGLRVLGLPEHFARCYYQAGADELLYMDVVASLYGRNNLKDVIRRTAESIFIPITAGGGVRTIEDVRELLRAGSDKVAITLRPPRTRNLSARWLKLSAASAWSCRRGISSGPGNGWPIPTTAVNPPGAMSGMGHGSG